MRLEAPKVSCIMPEYNAERFIRPAVDSILAQTFEDFDPIILNDGSTDKLYLESLETGADVQRACHEFIQYYNHKRDHSSIGNQPPMVFCKLAA